MAVNNRRFLFRFVHTPFFLTFQRRYLHVALA